MDNSLSKKSGRRTLFPRMLFRSFRPRLNTQELLGGSCLDQALLSGISLSQLAGYLEGLTLPRIP